MMGVGPFIDWSWIAGHGSLLGTRLEEHLLLTGVALAAGLAISLPVGIYGHRHRRVFTVSNWIADILYSVPSLALFAFLLPFTGLTDTTVAIGLTTYTLLILIRNVVAGLDGVPDDVREAAKGMGLTRRQILWRVEMPLALPVIVAGVRVAAVSTIALVTVGALIGRGGFGQLIVDGLEQGIFITPILLGAICSVVLALVADGLLILFQRALTPWVRVGSAS